MNPIAWNTRSKITSLNTIAIAFALTVAVSIMAPARYANAATAEIVQCGQLICTQSFSISANNEAVGGGDLQYNSRTGDISLALDNVTGGGVVNPNGRNGLMWLQSDGTQIMLNSLSGNADPVLGFGLAVRTSATATGPQSFAFNFDLPISIQGEIKATSQLNYDVNSLGAAATISGLGTNSIMQAFDTGVGGLSIDKGVDLGGPLTAPAGTLVDSGILGATNFFDLAAGFSLMTVLVAFTLDPNALATINGQVAQVVVPLPAALPLLLSGLLGIGLATRRRRRAAAQLS